MEHTYVYVCPRERGYKEIKVGKKDRNYLLPYRKSNLFTRQEWWYSEKGVLIHHLTNFFGKVVAITLFLINGLIHGFANPQLYRDYKRLLQERKYGAFGVDSIGNWEEKYEYVKNLVEKGE